MEGGSEHLLAADVGGEEGAQAQEAQVIVAAEARYTQARLQLPPDVVHQHLAGARASVKEWSCS